MSTYDVLILMGSPSDREVMEEAGRVLDDFGVAYRMAVASAHRSPERVRRIVNEAREAGCRVFIAGAGWAAHLAGVVASLTTRPVIGVPLASSPLQGIDSLLSTVQMPAGVPVAGVALGRGGAKNAGLLAVSILSLANQDLEKRLEDHKLEMAAALEDGGQDSVKG